MTVSDDQCLSVFQFGLGMFIKMHIDTDNVNNLNKSWGYRSWDNKSLTQLLFTTTHKSVKVWFHWHLSPVNFWSNHKFNAVMKDTSSTHIQNIWSIKANNHVPQKMAQLTPEDKQPSQATNELPVKCNRLLMLDLKQEQDKMISFCTELNMRCSFLKQCQCIIFVLHKVRVKTGSTAGCKRTGKPRRSGLLRDVWP